MPTTNNKPKLFLSYKSEIAIFVAKVCHCLERQANIYCYFNEEQKKAGDFPEVLEQEIKTSNYFILFVNSETCSSRWQNEEIKAWIKHINKKDKVVIVNMSSGNLQVDYNLTYLDRIYVSDIDENSHVICADTILIRLGINHAPFDDLPTSIDEEYEKDIIKKYQEGGGTLNSNYLKQGYPMEWPSATSYNILKKQNLVDNPLNQESFGKHRKDNSSILVDARLHQNSGSKPEEEKKNFTLTFPEAGPRNKILLSGNLRIAILVSGGIAPGINAVISSIVDRHQTYVTEFGRLNRNMVIQFFGCIEGFRSLCLPGGTIENLDLDNVKAWANRGGSVLPTARVDDLLNEDPIIRTVLLNEIGNTLFMRGIDILYIIGGEGSMRAAHAIWTIYKRNHPGNMLRVIGVPKTMDNDILWVWQSFGFLSAVQKARKVLIDLYTEAISNPRVGIVQLFGSSSGFVASHAALGSNVCDLALVPELKFNMSDVCKYMGKKICDRLSGIHRNPYGLIVMAETAIPVDYDDYYKEKYVGLSDKEIAALDTYGKKRKFRGQTPDELRSASLKIVSNVLKEYINSVMGDGNVNALGSKPVDLPQGMLQSELYWHKFRIFTNEPRHQIRSMEPSVSDIAYGIRLGTMAVDMAMAGYTDCMVSQWLTEYVAVPLKLVVLGRKQMPREGIFWKTVISRTGQIAVDSLS